MTTIEVLYPYKSYLMTAVRCWSILNRNYYLCSVKANKLQMIITVGNYHLADRVADREGKRFPATQDHWHLNS